MKLRVNLITSGIGGTPGPKCPIILFRLGRIRASLFDAEAQEICRRREELRAEARERREKAEAKKEAKRREGKRQSNLPNRVESTRAWHGDPRLSSVVYHSATGGSRGGDWPCHSRVLLSMR